MVGIAASAHAAGALSWAAEERLEPQHLVAVPVTLQGMVALEEHPVSVTPVVGVRRHQESAWIQRSRSAPIDGTWPYLQHVTPVQRSSRELNAK